MINGDGAICWVDHVLDHVLDHLLDHVLDHVLDQESLVTRQDTVDDRITTFMCRSKPDSKLILGVGIILL